MDRDKYVIETMAYTLIAVVDSVVNGSEDQEDSPLLSLPVETANA